MGGNVIYWAGNTFRLQWRIQDFPDGGGCQPIISSNSSQKLHEHDKDDVVTFEICVLACKMTSLINKLADWPPNYHETATEHFPKSSAPLIQWISRLYTSQQKMDRGAATCVFGIPPLDPPMVWIRFCSPQIGWQHPCINQHRARGQAPRSPSHIVLKKSKKTLSSTYRCMSTLCVYYPTA